MLLLWVVQLMFFPQRMLPASVLQLLSVAQSSSRSLTAIAAHPLCRAVSSLEGGRGRPPEQCREREEKAEAARGRVFLDDFLNKRQRRALPAMTPCM